MSNPSHMASTHCYLNHRYGASRARFFRGFGFRAEAWEIFAAALRERSQQNEVTLAKEAGFRPRYEVDSCAVRGKHFGGGDDGDRVPRCSDSARRIHS